MRFGKTYADRSASAPLWSVYSKTGKASTGSADIENTRRSFIMDSSVYTPTITVDGKETNDYNALIQGDKMTSWYTIDAPPTPNGPTNPDEDSWLKKNIVLVIVVGVVGFMVLAALLYCLCCKANKHGYQNALYDEDSSMKARIQ